MAKLVNRSNTYDRLLTFFILLQIFGGFGGAMQPIRIFVILSIPAMILHYIKKTKKIKEYQWLVFFFILWEIIGFISLFWVESPADGLKDLLYIFIGFTSFFLVLYLSENASHPQESIIKGWILFFVLTIPIAIIELVYDIHLPMESAHEEGLIVNLGTESIQRNYAAVTFYNLNGYNLKLCYVFPFIISQFFRNDKLHFNVLSYLIFCLLLYIIIVNGSRSAFLLAILGFIFFSFFSMKRKTVITLLCVIILLFVFFVYPYIEIAFKLLLLRFETQGLIDPARTEILEKGIIAFVDSGFMGIGAGNFAYLMKNQYNLSILSPHNLFLEIGLQYGLIIFTYFICILFSLFLIAKRNPLKRNRLLVYVSLLVFPLISIIDSGYLVGVPIWLFGASLFVIANSKFNKS